MALGVVGLVAASTHLVEVSLIAAAVVFALIIFHLVVGWKVRGLARIP